MKYKEIPERMYDGIEDIAYAENPDLFLPPKWRFLKVETIIARDEDWDVRRVPSFSSAAEVVKFIVEVLTDLDLSDRERLYAIFTDRKFRVHGIHEVTVGTATATLANPSELFRAAVIAGAVHIFFVHNHPAGSVQPSSDDRGILRRVVEVGALLGIEVIDFIIIGHGGSYYSAKEAGEMPMGGGKWQR